MNRNRRTGYWLGLLIIVAVAAGILFFQKKPMITSGNNPHIAYISATVEHEGEIYNCDIPESEISRELNDELISLFLQQEMRNRLLPRPQCYAISEGSVYFSIQVSLDNADYLSMRVNLSNLPDYSSAQFRDTHYRIVNHQELYQAVYDLLSDTIAAHSVKW